MSRSETSETENPSPTPAAADAEQTPATNNASSASAVDQPTAEADPLAVARKEAAENYERYLRAVADMENFRRRTVREKEELRLFASARVLEDLLPVLDTLGLGLAAAKQPNADLKTLTGGIEMVLQQFKSALANHGLKEVNPLGQPFDANLHEALSAQPSADVAEGSVLNVIRTGFTLNGRLLRPASVIVSSGPAQEQKS